MDEQILGGKTVVGPVIKSVESLSKADVKSFAMNPAKVAAPACCDVDHSQHAQFEEETDIWDKLGMFLSMLCAIHCLITPILILALPVLGQAFEAPWVHWAMAVFILPIGVFAFWSGFKHHHQKRVLALGLTGLLFVTAGTTLPHSMVEFFEHDIVTIIGSILLVTAHYFNRKACHCDSHSH